MQAGMPPGLRRLQFVTLTDVLIFCIGLAWIRILTREKKMRLTVANDDRTADIGRDVSAAAKAMVAAKSRDDLPIFFSPGDSVLTLKSSKNEAEYMDRLTTLLLSRTGIGTFDFYVPRKPGFLGSVGAVVKRILWRLLRYQHDRVAFQQNFINIQLTAAIEFMQAEYEHKIDVLEKKVAALEKRGT